MFERELEFGGQILRGGVVVEGLLQLHQLRGSGHVMVIAAALWQGGGGGDPLFCRGLSHHSVLGAIRLYWGRTPITNHTGSKINS